MFYVNKFNYHYLKQIADLLYLTNELKIYNLLKKTENNYNPLDWYKKVVIDNYANFEGRARRSEYWYFVLINFIVSLGLGFVSGLVGLTFNNGNSGILDSIYSLLIIVPSIAVGVRRMHDVGKSGWYLLIPFYNFYLAVTEGEHQKNEYGNNPKAPIDEINEIGTLE